MCMLQQQLTEKSPQAVNKGHAQVLLPLLRTGQTCMPAGVLAAGMLAAAGGVLCGVAQHCALHHGKG